MERNLIMQRVKAGFAAAGARGRKGRFPRTMSVEMLKDAQQLMEDKSRSIPDIRKDLGDMVSGTLYHYVHADGKLKEPGIKLLGSEY